MIARLQGKIVEKGPTELIVDCHGVGYAVLVPVHLSQAAVLGSEMILHTYLAVREDALQLFGFRSHDERTVFLQLISISGIGGKTALTILSAAEIKELRNAVVRKDSSFLQRLPGIGKKTAERIILELQDKMLSGAEIQSSEDVASIGSVQNDTIAAMLALGYNRQAAEKSVRAVLRERSMEEWSVDSLLRAALQSIQ